MFLSFFSVIASQKVENGSEIFFAIFPKKWNFVLKNWKMLYWKKENAIKSGWRIVLKILILGHKEYIFIPKK